jgi:hypothetical protein
MLQAKDMSYDDMKAYFANNELGSYHGKKKEQLREVIEAHLEDNDKELSQKIPEIVSAPVASNKPLEGTVLSRTKNKVKLIIHESANEHDINPVPVSVNGYAYIINRGVEVDVPKAVAEVLNNARMTVYDRKQDENGNEYLKPREALSYPFSILG